MARAFPKPSSSARRAASPNFTIQGAKLLERKFKLLSRNGRLAVIGVIAQAAENIRRKAGAKAPRDSGQLQHSIVKDVFADGLTVKIGAHLPYSLYVEAGSRTKPGKLPISGGKGHWQVDPDFAAWASRHGINPWALMKSWGAKETRMYAQKITRRKKFLNPNMTWPKVARVKRKGIKGKHYLFPSMVSERQPYLDALQKAIYEDGVALTVQQAGVGAE